MIEVALGYDVGSSIKVFHNKKLLGAGKLLEKPRSKKEHVEYLVDEESNENLILAPYPHTVHCGDKVLIVKEYVYPE